MAEELATQLIKRYGEKAYYKKLEEFHRAHEKATSIEYDYELNAPIRAVYVFEPVTVLYEHLKLIEALQNTSGGGGENK